MGAEVRHKGESGLAHMSRFPEWIQPLRKGWRDWLLVRRNGYSKCPTDAELHTNLHGVHFSARISKRGSDLQYY